MADEDFGMAATCVNCAEIFRFSAKDQLKLVKCPHCKAETALGERGLERIREKATMYFCLGVVFIVLGIIVTAGTYVTAKPGGYYILYFGGFLAGLMYLLKACSIRATRMSRIGYLVAIGPGSQGTSPTGVEGQVRVENSSNEVETVNLV